MTNVATLSIKIIYDGFCPFCSAYLRLLMIKDIIPNVEVFDAREYPELVRQLAESGYNLNSGLALLWGSDVYFGADAMHTIALLSSGPRMINHINYWLLKTKRRARLAYPVLRAGRAATLFLLRRSKIEIP